MSLIRYCDRCDKEIKDIKWCVVSFVDFSGGGETNRELCIECIIKLKDFIDGKADKK